MTHQRKQTGWLRLGLLAAVLVVIGLLPGASHATVAQSGGSISYGAKVFGALSADVPLNTYSFPGSVGDVMTVIADNWTGTLDLRAEVVAPNGVIVGSSVQNTLDDNLMGVYLSAVLPGDGIYVLRISGENGTTGEYALTLLGHGAPASTPLLFGQAVTVSLTPGVAPQLYSFEAEDCPTIFSVTDLSPGSYPFVVKVYDQRGQTVALLRGGEALEDWVTVAPRSGHYEVEVSSDDTAQTGSVQLLIHCGADAPGCPAGEPAVEGVPIPGADAACAPCFTPGDTPNNGGCPDLGFHVEQAPDNPLHATVTWIPMSGATGYAVYLYGQTGDSGEMYLAHGVWSEGNPLSFTWFLPEGYVSFRFVLRVYIGDEIVCTAETGLAFEIPPDQQLSHCDNFTITGELTDPVTREVTWTWDAYPGAVAYAASWFEVLADESELLQGSVLLDAATTSLTVPLPAPTSAGDRWRIRVVAQVGGAYVCTEENTFQFHQQLHACLQFSLGVTANTGTAATIEWSAYPGAEGFVLTAFDATHTALPGWPVSVAPTQLSFVLELPPGDYFFEVAPWTESNGPFCAEEIPVSFGAGMTCFIRSERRDVPMRIGPGTGYAIFADRPADTEIQVIGQAQDSGGARWWQLDTTQIPGGGGVAGGLWVLQDQVEADPICGQVPLVEIPDLPQSEFQQPPIEQPEQSQPPEQPAAPGEWLPCGSCDSCGHPAGECVTSPEGACLWDPTTCVTEPPPGQWLPCGSCESCGHPAGECVTSPEGACLWDPATCVTEPPPEEEEDEPPQCVGVAAAANPPNAAPVRLLTTGNCFSEIPGNYTVGTSVQAQYGPGNCRFNNWSGCASGTANPIGFTATSTCTIVANFTCP